MKNSRKDYGREHPVTIKDGLSSILVVVIFAGMILAWMVSI